MTRLSQRHVLDQRLQHEFVFNEGAHSYDDTIEYVAPQYQLIHDTLLAFLHDHFGRNEDPTAPYWVADVGAGTGMESVALLTSCDRAHVVAIDQSQSMLEELINRATSAGVHSRVIPVHADFLSVSLEQLTTLLPQDVTAFDAVMTAFTFHHFSNDEKRQAYGRCWALLREGGVMVNADLASYRSTWLTDLAYSKEMEWIRRSFENAAARSPENATFLHSLRDEWLHHYAEVNRLEPLEDQQQMLDEIGFADTGCAYRLWQTGILVGVRPPRPE